MSSEAIEYSREPVTIGTPTDITGMRVIEYPQGYTAEHTKPYGENWNREPKKYVPHEKKIFTTAKKKKKPTRNIGPKPSGKRGRPPKEENPKQKRVRKTSIDYTEAESLARTPKYQDSKGRVKALQLSRDLGISYQALVKHLRKVKP